MKIHRISVPTPFKVGPVNVYVLEQDPLTVIDTGPYTEEAVNALRSGLAGLGLKIPDIKRVILSHAHADHFGLARLIWEESGAEVYIHEWDAAAVAGPEDHSPFRRLLVEAGVPPEGIERLREGGARFREWEQRLDSVNILRDQDEIVFDHESLTVIHTPGHTPGSICLLRKSNRLMFSADTIIKHITPNPVLNVDPIDPDKRFQSLGEYLVSLARVKTIAPTLLKGGHGEDLTDYDEYFNRLYQFTRLRQTKLLSQMPPGGTTAWEASFRLFPAVRGGDNRFLALSETVAHLDFAVSEGKLAIENASGADVFRA
jgi:glyoxylase-like metal-dependent hydrolase (beta-lactamase superfamily II)